VVQLHFGTGATPLCTSLASGLLGWNGTQLCNGTPVSLTFGSTTIPLNSTAPTISQTLIYDGTKISPVQAGVQASSITTLGSPVVISGGTNISVLTKAVTMPSLGCPCRAFVSYGAFVDFTNAGQVAMYVNDGTNSFATAETLTTGSASNFGVNGTSFSTGTYANSAAITFTLYANSNAAGTSTVLVNNGPGAGQATWMNVAIFPSN
jgi:hypothetical protein